MFGTSSRLQWHISFANLEISASCLNISFAFVGGADFLVAARSVRWNQVCERGLHVRLMVRVRCGRGMREASESPSRVCHPQDYFRRAAMIQ